jgi:hypothetical protein
MPRSMPPTYLSGEDIQAGDHILYHGESGQVEFVAFIGDADPNRWYAEQFGNGCMIVTPDFGRVFVTESNEDLQFLSRDALPPRI